MMKTYTDNRCTVCKGKVPRGRLYTCSDKCQRKRMTWKDLRVRRIRERTVKQPPSPIAGWLSSLFG